MKEENKSVIDLDKNETQQNCKSEKKTIFWKVYIVFFAILIVLCVVFLICFNNFIKKFEKNKVAENESIAQSLEEKRANESLEQIKFLNDVSLSIEEEKPHIEETTKIELIKEPLAKEDISNLVRTYSLFTSGDLPGPNNGIKQLLPYVVKNTKLYYMIEYFAISYVDGVKVHHSLGKPPFRNEKIGDIVPISEDEFMVHVSIDKVMIDNKNQEYLDHFETDMIFQFDYKTQSWKWASTRD